MSITEEANELFAVDLSKVPAAGQQLWTLTDLEGLLESSEAAGHGDEGVGRARPS